MSLEIDTIIAPAAPLARAHNALVDLIRSVAGENGIQVVFSESKIVIKLDDSVRSNLAEANVAQVLTPAGLISNVPRHSTYGTPNVYTNSFQVQATLNATSVWTTIDANGVAVNYTASNHCQVTTNKIEFVGGGGSNTAKFDPNGLRIGNGSNTVAIDFGDITKNMTIREVDVCDANVAKKMLVLASAPY